jgi:hypothetical protein
MLEDQTHHTHRNGRDDEKPAHALIDTIDASVTNSADKPATDRQPVPPVIHEQRDRGRKVQADKKREVEAFVGGLSSDEMVPPQPRWHQHRVPETRDRK